MRTLADYTDPFKAISDFEIALAQYTGAPYCITTDCCTHAIEIAFRLTHDKTLPVSFPTRTYLSVLMTMHELGISYELIDKHWRDYYVFGNTNIWDCARYFKKDMYQTGTIQCVSFGVTKPLQIGRGGCILTDDATLYRDASRMRYDGRDIFAYSPWAEQKEFRQGFHYYLRPEECVAGLNLLDKEEFTVQIDKFYNYPDCREITIKE
jgi:dTDP-4-amino-4,6-dideoxygalactose transaminase